MTYFKPLILVCGLGFVLTACSQENTPLTQPEQQIETQHVPETSPSQQTTAQKVTTPRTPQANQSNLSAQQSSLSGANREFNIAVRLSSDVLFDFGEAKLKPQAFQALDDVVGTIQNKAKGVISITGHTDSKGSDAANLKLSFERAEAVKNYFLSKGLNFDYQIDGKGESEPIAPNQLNQGEDNPEGRQKNRRVDIIINKNETLGQRHS